MTKKLYFLFFLLIAGAVSIRAQIIAPDTVCINAPVTLTSAVEGTSFTWAFDSVNVQSSITTANTTKRVLLNDANMQGATTPIRFDTSNGRYYAFWGNWNGNTTIYKMDFGTNPLSTPAVSAVSIAGMGFAGNDNGHMDLVWDADAGNWYLFWGGRNASGSYLLRVNFGNTLANAPVSGNTLIMADLGYPFQITVKKYGNEWIMFAASNWGTVSRYDFGTSLQNTPTPVTLPGSVNKAGYFSLYQQGSNWYMILVTTTTSTAYRLDFGANLKNNAPTLTAIGTTGGVTKSVRLLPNAVCSTQLFGYGIDESARLIKFDFQGNVNNNTPSIASMGTFFGGRPIEMSTFVRGDTIYALVCEFSGKNIVALPLVALPAGTVQRYYNRELTHSFTAAGTYTVTLMVDQGAPSGPSTFCKQIVVVSGVAPIAPGAFTDSQRTVCREQQQVRYAITPVPGASGYTWSYTGMGATISGNGDTAVLIDFSAAATSGTLRVSAISNGACGTAPGPARELAITVNPLPAVTVTPGGNVTFCQGRSLALTAQGGTNRTYQWKQGTTNVGTNDPLYYATAAGSYSVIVTDNITQCTNTSAATNVSTDPSPGAAVTPAGPVTFCAGDTATLQALPAGAGLTYEWLESGQPTGITTASRSVYVSGTHAVVVTNTYNCSDTSATVSVTAHPLPVVTVTPSGSTHICQGDQVVLQAGTGTGFSYQWKNGNNTVVGNSSSYTASTAGDYRVVVTDGNSCTDSSAPVPVTVYLIPDVVITPGDTVFCAKGYVLLEAVSSATGLVYQWKKDGAGIPYATVSFYEANESGDYSVVAYIPNVSGCVDSAEAINVKVNPLPQPEISWNGMVLYTDSGYQGYQWYFDAQELAGATHYQYFPQEPGSYTVSVTDSNGCTKISEIYNLYRMGNGLFDLQSLGASIQTYPNPAGATVRFRAPFPVDISLSSYEGRILIQKEKTEELDISGLAPGMYVVRISGEGILIKTEKLIKTATGR